METPAATDDNRRLTRSRTRGGAPTPPTPTIQETRRRKRTSSTVSVTSCLIGVAPSASCLVGPEQQLDAPPNSPLFTAFVILIAPIHLALGHHGHNLVTDNNLNSLSLSLPLSLSRLSQ